MSVFGALLFQDAVDGGVEEGAVGGDVEAFGVRLAADFVEPAGAVRIAADEFDVFPEGGIAAGEMALGGAVDIADGLEALDGTDDFAAGDVSAFGLFPLHLHHFTEHARGEFGEADPPTVGFDFAQPEMGRTVAALDGQVRDEGGSFVERGLGHRGGRGLR